MYQAEAKALLNEARALSDLSREARAGFLENELNIMDSLAQEFGIVAEQQSRRLVEAHERFSSLMDHHRYQVVYSVLPHGSIRCLHFASGVNHAPSHQYP